MYAVAPLAVMASRTARILAGCGVTTCGITTAEGEPAGRLAAASASTARIPARSPPRAASLPVPPAAATAFPTVRSAPGVARAGPARSRERLSHSGSVVAGDQQYVKTRENGHAAESDARGHLCPPRRKHPGPRSQD